AKYKFPTEIEFRKELPKPNVGKILKKILREEETKKEKKANEVSPLLCFILAFATALTIFQLIAKSS
ncbi:MAG: hypothetical protein KAU60_11800, partial [Desulfobacterales bacterium]|nr:hypothetical protein [Desulfobacterales bacterium]